MTRNISQDEKALLNAVYNKVIDTVTTLLNSGVNPNIVDPVTRLSPLGYAADGQPTAENIDIIKLLIDKGADPNLSGEGRSPPIFYALQGTNDSITLALLDAPGIQLDILGGWNEQAPLHYAVYGNQINVVKKMLEKGVDVNIKDKEKQTPLHIAADRGLPEITELLIQNGADLEAQDRGGLTPLMIAAESDSLESAKILLKAGANIKARNSAGLDALFFACNNYASDEMITFLIQSGASIYEKIIGEPIKGSSIKLNVDGKSVLELARSNHFGDRVYDTRIKKLLIGIDKKIKSRKNVLATHKVTSELGLPLNISYAIGSYLGNQTPENRKRIEKSAEFEKAIVLARPKLATVEGNARKAMYNKIRKLTRSGKKAENIVAAFNIEGGSRRRKTRRCKKNRV